MLPANLGKECAPALQAAGRPGHRQPLFGPYQIYEVVRRRVNAVKKNTGAIRSASRFPVRSRGLVPNSPRNLWPAGYCVRPADQEVAVAVFPNVRMFPAYFSDREQ